MNCCIKDLEKISRQNESEIRDHFLFQFIESPQNLNFFLKNYAIEIYHLEKMNSQKDKPSTEIIPLLEHLDIKFDDIKDIELSQAQLDLFNFYSSKTSSDQLSYTLMLSAFSQRKVIAVLVLDVISYLKHKFSKYDFQSLKIFFEREIKNEYHIQNLKNELNEMIISKNFDCNELKENLKTFYQLREKVWHQIQKKIQLQKGIA